MILLNMANSFENETILWPPELTHHAANDPGGEWGEGGHGNWKDWICSELSILNWFGSAGLRACPELPSPEQSVLFTSTFVEVARVYTSRKGSLITTLWMLTSYRLPFLGRKKIAPTTSSVAKPRSISRADWAHHDTCMSTLYLKISNMYSVRTL